MGDVVVWILVIVSTLLLVGIIGSLIAFVAGLFKETRRPAKRKPKANKKKHA
jgi:hypothetical protein